MLLCVFVFSFLGGIRSIGARFPPPTDNSLPVAVQDVAFQYQSVSTGARLDPQHLSGRVTLEKLVEMVKRK